MASRRRLLDAQERSKQISRRKLLDMAMSVALDDDYEDWYMYSGMKRERQHLFWMAPFLSGRTDATQRNTFAKLESDFLRVSSKININLQIIK